MAVIGFDQDQDPAAPQGAGMFHLDDGRSIYAHDPEMAQSISGDQRERLYGPGYDQRVAGPGGAPQQPDPTAGLNWQGINSPNGGGAEYDARKKAEQPQIGAPAAPPKDVMAPAQAGPGGKSEQEINAQKDFDARLKRQGAPTPEKWIPKAKAETVETSGVPYNAEDAAMRIKANADVMRAKSATADMLTARAENAALAAKDAQPELLQKAAEAQKALDAQHAAYVKERADLERAINESNNAQGGASEWFANKSTPAQVAIILGQAFGAYAATLSHGQNWAQQQINAIMEHDIAAQKEQAKRGVDNAYRRLELRYKNQDQAEAALRIAQTNVLNNVQSMHASANQAQDVRAAHQEMLAENQEKLVQSEQSFQNAAYGKHTVKVDIAHQPGSAGGPPDRLALMKRYIDAGFSKEEAKRLAFGEGGGSSQADAIDRKNVATINGQPYEFDSPDAAKAAQEKAPHVDRLINQAEELKGLLKKGAWTPEDRARASTLQRGLMLEVPSAFSGSTRLNEPELHAAKEMVGDPDAILKTDVTGRAGAALDVVINNAKAEREGVMQGGMRVNRQTIKNDKGQRERGYSYQTSATTAQEVE